MTIDEIKQANKDAGRHFFDKDTLKHFGSRILATVFKGNGGIFFITAEKDPGGDCFSYSVRHFNPETGAVKTAKTKAGFETYGAEINARSSARLLSEGKTQMVQE